MRKYLILILLIMLSLPVNAGVKDKAVSTTNKIIFPDWLKQGTLKWGMVGSFCFYQALNGATEGYHFRQEPTHLINEGNYHAFATAQRGAGIITGWFVYANCRDKNQTWFNKGRRIIGTALLGRNFFEWFYKGVRYGNSFDYSESRNKHAVVYFGIRDGKLIDLYIGTGEFTGPLVDMGFLLLGALILK